MMVATTRMSVLSRMSAGLAVCVLSACGLAATFAVDPFLDEEISGTDFNSHLAREYQRRTGMEMTVDGEWIHAGRLARKGFAAMRGETVPPWDPADWNVAKRDLSALAVARARLMSALDGGGRAEFPEACAKAQVYYDGWLEQSHDNDFGLGFAGPVQPERVSAGRAAFDDMIPLCEGVIDPNRFLIYFGWDKTNLTAAARQVIDEIAGIVERLRVPQVGVTGYADSSGPAGYNIALSERRARAVAAALRARGVIVTGVAWHGETAPAVPTGADVREPLNRRAEVILSR